MKHFINKIKTDQLGLESKATSKLYFNILLIDEVLKHWWISFHSIKNIVISRKSWVKFKIKALPPDSDTFIIFPLSKLIHFLDCYSQPTTAVKPTAFAISHKFWCYVCFQFHLVQIIFLAISSLTRVIEKCFF